MTYTKPEIAVLGDASRLIQGAKSSAPEGPIPGPPLFELED
jgi:hypothetical protein